MPPFITHLNLQDIPWADHPSLAGVQSKCHNHPDFPPDDILLARVIPGGEIPWHVHPEQSEFAYVISGTGELLGKDADDAPTQERLALAPGGVVVIPPGRWHRLTNTSPEELILLALHIPATL